MRSLSLDEMKRVSGGAGEPHGNEAWSNPLPVPPSAVDLGAAMVAGAARGIPGGLPGAAIGAGTAAGVYIVSNAYQNAAVHYSQPQNRWW